MWRSEKCSTHQAALPPPPVLGGVAWPPRALLTLPELVTLGFQSECKVLGYGSEQALAPNLGTSPVPPDLLGSPHPCSPPDPVFPLSKKWCPKPPAAPQTTPPKLPHPHNSQAPCLGKLLGAACLWVPFPRPVCMSPSAKGFSSQTRLLSAFTHVLWWSASSLGQCRAEPRREPFSGRSQGETCETVPSWLRLRVRSSHHLEEQWGEFPTKAYGYRGTGLITSPLSSHRAW